jgi:hypothetical protein
MCNPVVTCKHCGCENVQESMSVLGGVIVLFAGGVIVFMLARKTGHGNGSLSWMLYAVPFIFGLQYVWWKFFTKLREL